MEITGIVSLIIAILACVGWSRSLYRINQIERKQAFANQKLSDWLSVSRAASKSATICWLGLNTIMRHLAADVPAEQWLAIMEEVRNGQAESGTGGRSSGELEGAGPRGAVERSEAGATEGDD